MDWTIILNYVLGGGTLLGTITSIFFFRKSRRKEEADTQLKEIEAERAKMELGEDYLQKVMELSERTYQATLKNGTDNESIIRKVDDIATVQKDIVSYLNGGFQEYLNQKEGA